MNIKLLNTAFLFFLAIAVMTPLAFNAQDATKPAPAAKKAVSKPKSTTAKPGAAKKGATSKSKLKKKAKDKEEELLYGKGKKGKKKEGDAPEAEVRNKDTRSLLKGKVDMRKQTSGGTTTNNTGGLYRPVYVGKTLVTGNITSVQGFRICIYNGNNRDSALAIKRQFMKDFKTYNSYMSYSLPSYKIKIGDWDNKKTAQNILKQIVKRYPIAFIIPDVVTKKNILVYKNN